MLRPKAQDIFPISVVEGEGSILNYDALEAYSFIFQLLDSPVLGKVLFGSFNHHATLLNWSPDPVARALAWHTIAHSIA